MIFTDDNKPLGNYYNEDGTKAKYGEGKFIPTIGIVHWYVNDDKQSVSIPNASMVEILI